MPCDTSILLKFEVVGPNIIIYHVPEYIRCVRPTTYIFLPFNHGILSEMSVNDIHALYLVVLGFVTIDGQFC